MSQSERRKRDKSESRVVSKESTRSGPSRSGSVRSNYGGSISDIETDDSERYRKIAKKLAKDKVLLKEKMSELSSNLEKKDKERRHELEKTQEYFQDQINELTEDRDRISDELSKIKELFYDEKEKMRKSYEDKLGKEKGAAKKMTGKDQQIVKRLENTITTLQDRLTEQSDANANLKVELAGKTKSLEVFEEQFKKAQEQFTQHRIESRTILQTAEAKKDDAMKKKDDEIVKLISDRNTAIYKLQMAQQEFDAALKLSEKKKEADIAEIRSGIEKSRVESERKMSEFMLSGKRSVEAIRDECEKKLSCLQMQKDQEIESVKKSNDKILQDRSLEFSKILESERNNYRKEIDEYKKVILKFQTDLTSLAEKSNIMMSKKDDDCRRAGEVMDEAKKILLEKERELQETHIRIQKIQEESDSAINTLKEQQSQYKDTIKRLQEAVQTFNSQFSIKLKEQKDLADNDISQRDITIENLEKQAKKMTDEYLDRMNIQDRKIKNLTQDVKELTDKNSTLKTTIDRNEATIESIRLEAAKYKDNYDNVSDRLRSLQVEKDIQERKLISEYERKKAECDTASKEFGNATTECARLKKLYGEEMKAKAMEYQAEKDKTVKEFEKRIGILENSVRMTESSKVDIQRTLQNVIVQRDMNKMMADTLPEKEAQIMDLTKKNELLVNAVNCHENARKTVERTRESLDQNLNEAITRRDLLEKERKEIIRKYNQLETSYRNLDTTLSESKKTLAEVLTERDNYKTYYDIYMEKDSQVTELGKKVESLLGIVKLKDQARSAAESERSAVASQLNTLEVESKRQLAEVVKKLDSAKLSLNMRDQTLAALEKERNNLSKKVEDLESEKSKIFTDMTSKIEAFSNMKIQAEKEVRSLQSKLEICRLENGKAVSELQNSLAVMSREKSVAENDRRTAELKVLASESEKNRYLADATKKLDSLSAFATQTEKVRQTLEVQNQTMNKERNVLGSKISSLELERQNLTSDLKSKITTISEMERVVLESQRIRNDCESRIKTLENRLATSETVRNGLLAEVAKKSDAISNLHKEKSSLDGQISIMKKNKQLSDSTNERRMEEVSAVVASKVALIKRHENLIEEMRQDLDAARSRLASVNSLSVQNVDLLDQIRILKEAASAMKKEFEAEITRVKEEARTESFNMMKKVNQLEMELDFSRKASEKMRYDFTDQVSSLKRDCTAYSDRCKVMDDDHSSLSARTKILAQRFSDLEKRHLELLEECKNRKIDLDQREIQIKKLEENYRNAPPKLIDPSLKRDRDEALSLVRQQKADMAILKDEMSTLTQKLTLAEMLIKDLEKDKTLLNDSQRELKSNFLANLNSQEDRFHNELITKNARIRELEDILTSKMKL